MRISDWSSDVCSSDLNSAQSLLSEPADSSISGFAAAPTLDFETQTASVPNPVPAAAFASFSSSPPPPPPPAPAPPAQPHSPPTALTLANADRKTVWSGQRLLVRVSLCGRRLLQTQTQ